MSERPSKVVVKVRHEIDMPETSSAPLLSICIPTYNRARNLGALVEGIVANVLPAHGNCVEVVVSDNCSTDGTANTLSLFSHTQIKVVRPEVHRDSAEQNMFSALPHLRGEYIWYLGDDDIPNYAAFGALIELVGRGESDCYIFNSPVLSPTGSVRDMAPIRMNATAVDMTIREAVASVGLLLTLAGITNIVQRRKLLSTQRAHHWADKSRIYSHVAWLAEANQTAGVRFVNLPIVYYRQNDYSDRRWELAAERDGVPDLYYWTFGLGALLRGLTDEGVLRHQDIGAILELSEDGRRYKLVDDMAFKVFQQIEKALESGEPRQWPQRDGVTTLLAFLRACDPLLFDVVALIEDFYSAAEDRGKSPDQVLATFRPQVHRLITDKQHAGVFFSRFCGRSYGFNVYRTAGGFVGLRDLSADEIEDVLGVLDPMPDDRHVIIANSTEAITDKARAINLIHYSHRSRPRPEAAAVPLMGGTQPVSEDRTIQSLSKEIAALRASTSWRITAPVRWVASSLRGRRARLQ